MCQTILNTGMMLKALQAGTTVLLLARWVNNPLGYVALGLGILHLIAILHMYIIFFCFDIIANSTSQRLGISGSLS